MPAPAKLTLSLRVTGVCDREPFHGFHLIDAVMTTLDLHDVLEIEELPSGSPNQVTYVGKYSSGLDGSSGDDLVSRALRVTGRSAAVTVTKNIPHGGGLGGGSADAATILRWAGITDLGVAARVGADVAFCLSGLGRARVRGIGEIVDPLPDDPGTVTLIAPPFSVSTPAVYRAFDAYETPHSRDLTDDWRNDLEDAATIVEPRLREWKRLITEECGVAPTLAGSGSTWFALGDHGHLATRRTGPLTDATVVVTSYR